MVHTATSINQNGCSVCEKGEEKYTRCVLGAFRGKFYYQYDYRHKDGELFSTLKETLDECRAERDKWLQEKRYNKLSPSIRKMIEENRRLTKCDMGCQIGHTDPFHVASIYWDTLKRDEVVEAFNRLFGTSIQ